MFSPATSSLVSSQDPVTSLFIAFDLHARFTQGAGRIHFRILRANPPVIRIAHIGGKVS